MRLKALTGSIIAASIVIMPVAAQAANAVGTVSGNGYIARGGKLIPVGAGTKVFAGDRIVTRADGSATLAGNGCSTTVGQSAMIAVDSACGANPVSFDAGRAGYAGRSSGLAGSALAIIVVAGVAAGAGIIAAASGGNSASP